MARLSTHRSIDSAQPPAPTPVILAGGRGTRLAPFTAVLPKPLMPLVDGPIIDVILRQLRDQGWSGVTLAVGHMAGLIRAYCGDGSRYGLEIDYHEEASPLGTVGPLASVPRPPEGAPFLVMNGDILTSLAFGDFIAAHRTSGAVASIAVQRRRTQLEFGVLDLGEDLSGCRRIVGFREKPEMTVTVSMGIYLFEPEVVDYIPEGSAMDLPELMDLLLADGHRLAGYPFDGYWLDIGRHSDYQQAIDDFERMRGHLLPEPHLQAAS